MLRLWVLIACISTNNISQSHTYIHTHTQGQSHHATRAVLRHSEPFNIPRNTPATTASFSRRHNSSASTTQPYTATPTTHEAAAYAASAFRK